MAQLCSDNLAGTSCLLSEGQREACEPLMASPDSSQALGKDLSTNHSCSEHLQPTRASRACRRQAGPTLFSPLLKRNTFRG